MVKLRKFKNQGRQEVDFSFGLRDVLCRLGSKLFRLCLLGGTFHCTCVAFHIRRNLGLTLHFSTPNCRGFLAWSFWAYKAM